MRDVIKLSKSCIGAKEKKAVSNVLEAGFLGMGQDVMLFEKDLESFFSHKMYVACVNTGTSALHVALQSCGIGEGDNVLIPSITYVASFQATSATGATPVACDIDMKTGCLDLEDTKKKITPYTKAIMYVHYASGVGDREGVYKLAKDFNLRVIEDAAHSFGGYERNELIGTNGDILCFSFDGIKNITCGEGGAVVSSDPEIIEKIQDLRLLGVKRDTQKRYNGGRSWDFDVEEQGWRYHMSNINAAIGREQLKKIGEFGEKRRYIARLYQHYLKGASIEFLDINYGTVVPHIFPILVDEKERDSLRDFLLNHYIETGIHYKPNHLLERYRRHDCPRAEEFGRRILSLPMHVHLCDDDIIRISSIVKDKLQ